MTLIVGRIDMYRHLIDKTDGILLVSLQGPERCGSGSEVNGAITKTGRESDTACGERGRESAVEAPEGV